MCPEETFEGKNLSILNHFSPSVCDFELLIFRILSKKGASVTKAAFYLSRLTFCRKNVLEKKNSTLSDFQGKTRRLSAGKCLEEISEGTNFSLKSNSNHFLTLGEKVSNFSPKVPSRAVRTAFYVYRGWILRNKFWKYTILWFSRTLSKSFRTSCDEFFAGLSAYAFYAPRGSFCENITVGNLRLTFTVFKP